MTTTQIIIIAAIVSFLVAGTVSTIAMLLLWNVMHELDEKSEDNQPKFKNLGMVTGKYEYDAWYFETMGEAIDMANKKAKEGWRLVKIHQFERDGKSPYRYWMIIEREIG